MNSNAIAQFANAQREAKPEKQQEML